MAPCRQLLMWSVPSIAVLLGIFWFKKKREYAKSDPGGRERIKSLKEELAEALSAEAELIRASPLGRIEKTVVKSAPIDIIPNGSGSQRSSPLEMTDEEIDLEIEKIIKKKSLEKEKKMSLQAESKMEDYRSQINSAIVTASEAPPCLSFKTELSNNKKEDNTGDQNSKEKDNHGHVNDTVPGDPTQQADRTECVESEDIGSEEVNTVTDNQELNDNNNIVNESENMEPSDSGNRFSASQNRTMSERDSANHSPVDPMLASPSTCHFSDNHSEVIFSLQYYKL